MTARAYAKTCTAILLGLLALTALVNRIVDPFWYFRDISITGFNEVKTQFHKYERQIKPIILKEKKPDAVIFSNSFFEVGFNPAHPGLTRDGSLLGYNFGIGAAYWDRVFCNALFAIDNTSLKVAVIGIHPGSMPMVDCSGQIKEMASLGPTTVLLSFDALKASYKTVTQQHRKPTHTLDGMLFYHRYDTDKVEDYFYSYFYNIMLQHKDRACPTADNYQPPAWSYPNGQVDIAGMKYLLKALAERNVQTKLVVYPEHALWFETLMDCNGALPRWQVLYELANAVREVDQGRRMVELWDFQGLSNFFSEKIRNGQVKYWQDNGHFNYEMGDAMLDVIFKRGIFHPDAQGDEFGVLLTPESLPGRYSRFVEKRREFFGNNPWFLHDLGKFRRQM